jgi:hypothetical protein
MKHVFQKETQKGIKISPNPTNTPKIVDFWGTLFLKEGINYTPYSKWCG